MTQIFRITHYKNLPFILEHGLHCEHSEIKDPTFTPIGFPTLINYRKDRIVPINPGGTLSDYIPFYFWIKSPMLYVIAKRNDLEVIKTPQEEIIYLVSSFERLTANNCRFVFTDRHAKLEYANFYSNPADKHKLQWDIIKSEQWGRQFGAERKEMKQAECLIYQYMPKEALMGIAVKNEISAELVNAMLAELKLDIPVKIKPEFYF